MSLGKARLGKASNGMELVFGIAVVKDEIDVIEYTVRHMLDEVHNVIVADNLSTDGTWEKLLDISVEDPRLKVIRDYEVGYYQSHKMSKLAERAAHSGATWVIPFDADEFWFAIEPGCTLTDALDELNYSIVPCRLVEHVPTPHDRPLSPWRRKGLRGQPKVAVRPSLPVFIHQGNHSASYPKPHQAPADILYARHFPYRSAKQFVSKIRNGYAAYQAAPDLPKQMGVHWRHYGEVLEEKGVQGLYRIFREQILIKAPAQNHGLQRDNLPMI